MKTKRYFVEIETQGGAIKVDGQGSSYRVASQRAIAKLLLMVPYRHGSPKQTEVTIRNYFTPQKAARQ